MELVKNMHKWGEGGVLKLLFCLLCQQSPYPIQQQSHLFLVILLLFL